jgi:hypothetical protein
MFLKLMKEVLIPNLEKKLQNWLQIIDVKKDDENICICRYKIRVFSNAVGLRVNCFKCRIV